MEYMYYGYYKVKQHQINKENNDKQSNPIIDKTLEYSDKLYPIHKIIIGSNDNNERNNNERNNNERNNNERNNNERNNSLSSSDSNENNDNNDKKILK